MALTYDYSACDTTGWTDDEHERAENFCFALLAVDVRDIHEKNQEEIFFRFKFLEKIGFNPFRNPIDNGDLKMWLLKLNGYRCNVSDEPRFKFIRRWIKYMEQDLTEQLLKL